MDYESDRALIELKMEHAKNKAIQDSLKYKYIPVGYTLDPLWPQPANTTKPSGTDVDDAQGFWVNGGRQGGTLDEPLDNSGTFDHDLPNLPKKPVEIPTVRRKSTCVLLWSS